MDRNDTGTIKMLETIGRLQSELDTVNARISELEAACVMGGDGKPIELGQERWYWNDYAKKKESFIVESYTAMLLGDTYLNPDTICIEPDRTYSSPEDVPEGGK